MKFVSAFLAWTPAALFLLAGAPCAAQLVTSTFYPLGEGTVEFRIVIEGESGDDPGEAILVEDLQGKPVWVSRDVLVGPELLQGLRISPGDARGRLASFLVEPAFCGNLYDVTALNIGNRVGVIREGRLIHALVLTGTQDDALHLHMGDEQIVALVKGLQAAPAPPREARLRACAETLESELASSFDVGKAVSAVRKYAQNLADCEAGRRVIDKQFEDQEVSLAYLLVGKCFSQKKRHEEAADFWAGALERSGEPGWEFMIRMRLAEEYRALGRLGDARDQYERVAVHMEQTQSPVSYTAHYELATLYEDLDQDQQALDRYRKALASLQSASTRTRVWNFESFERTLRARIANVEQRLNREADGDSRDP